MWTDTRYRQRSRRPAVLALGAALGLLLGVGGCAHYTDYSAFIRHPEPLVSSTAYRLAPPDVITITSKRVHEIDGHTEMIRPDGKITLPLLGSVFVAGKTCEQVSAELKKMAQKYYQDADVSLHVVQYNSKKIFVFGEVTTPGAYPYDGANTILGTLALAQPTRLADPDRIQVLRPNRHGKPIRRMTIDLNDMVKRGDVSHNALLEEGDIIYVPPNALATVGLAFQQLLLPIQPAAATVSGPGQIGQETTGHTYGRQTEVVR